jgi:hypothetical protein
MKKKFILAAVMLAAAFQTKAQTFSEWFRQSSTQRKYLIQQIAALQIYFKYAKKGYDIAQKGLKTIHDIKNGDFNLHNTFFVSLKNVNPAVKNYAKLADIIAMQTKIIRQAKKSIQLLKQPGAIAGNEANYCTGVFNSLLDDCIKTIDLLLLVTTSGKLEMKDDERIRQIDLLYADTQNKQSFCASFSNTVQLLCLLHKAEQTDINYSKLLNGIK